MAEKQPVIIKRVKKGGAGHHGGAWKVAYADFVTAMMAFFLLLWLLNSVTQEQLEGISNYFAPASTSTSTSGAGGVLGGQTIGEEGAEQSRRSKPSISLALPPPKLGTGGEEAAGQDTGSTPSEEEAAAAQAAREQEQFEEAAEELRETIEGLPNFKELVKNLLVDNTPEGLRIQLVDNERTSMFPRGSAEPYLHTRRLLELVSTVVNKMPQEVMISGHTDATKFVSDTGYSNWELSADRANAARRALLQYGVPAERVARVVGQAATEPLLADDPTHPRNRRISIVLLRHSADGNPPPDARISPTGEFLQ